MRETYIRKLIRLVEESEIESLEVSSWGRRIRITQRNHNGSNGHLETSPVIQATAGSGNPVSQAPPAAPPEPTPQEKKAPEVQESTDLVEIKAPMVGTFYAAPSPEADPYVSLNEKIAAGQVVCIVEAMKLMNEIESEISGRIAKICVENAQPVEFGQVLFLIDSNG
jgi:acetyl-CoA carboxylase biotin carboxyl carrier protein